MAGKWSYLVSLVVLVLSLANGAQAGEATADAFVRGAENGDTNYGTGGSVTIKNANGNSYDRKGYLRFAVSGAVSEASLDMTVSTNNEGGGGTTPQTFTMEVYGLAESLDHTWVEDEITWNNAPANDTATSDFTADATLLGSFIVDPLPVGNPVSFSDPALIEFINSDTDNEVTLMLRRTAGTSSSHNLAFASKENTSYSPPTLNFKVATQASGPDPADGAEDVSRDVTLAWMAGEFAATHDVYFGSSFDDVNDADRSNPMDVLVSQGQSEAAYELEVSLEYGQTYYWRVDEVNAAPDNAIFKGDVWSFATEPLGYPVENIIATASASVAQYGPELTVDGSGLNDNGEHATESADMWQADGSTVDAVWLQYEFDQAYKLYELLVWNYNVQWESVLGFGVKDVTIEYSADGETWTTLGDFEFARAPGTEDYTANTVVDLAGIRAQYVRLIINSSHGGSTSYGLSEVRFLYSPVQARYPDPADGQTNVAPDGMLSWRAGREAALHEIYLSTDQAAVADGSALVDTTTETTCSMAMLGVGYGRTYFWKINEVNEAEPVTSWESAIWSFSTEEFFVVEDFESYDDVDNLIYETWIDGWTNGSGSIVGYFEAPFAEQTIVNGGLQSMPLLYDNSFAPFYSEADFDLGDQDWTASGANTLRLFVRGEAPAFAEISDGTIVMSAIGTDIWNAADEGRFVYKSLTGNASMIVRVDALDSTPNTWVKGGIMVRQSTDAGAINAFIAMTGGGGGGATFQQRTAADTDTVSQHTYDGNPFAAPYWLKLERDGDTFSAFISLDGETWQQAGDVVTVAMTDPVLIGLMLTSHNDAQATSAAFSNLTTTGDLTGQWQAADVGPVQPTGGNDPVDLYVALEDATGQTAVVSHPTAAALTAWQEWLIPLSEFGGIDLARVATMHIGVGDYDNPSAGGDGIVYVDDISVGHPAQEQ